MWVVRPGPPILRDSRRGLGGLFELEEVRMAVGSISVE